MKYKIPIPRSRGFLVSQPGSVTTQTDTHTSFPHKVNADAIRDMFLHVMFARVAANDDTNWEFETKYDADNQYIELDIPEKFMQIIEGTSKGEYFKRYIRWLFEGSGFWEYDEENDVLIPTSKVCFNNYAGYSEIVDNGISSSSSPQINWCTGNKQMIILDRDVVFDFVDPCCKSTSLQFIVKQDAIGGHTITFPAEVKFANGVMPPQTTLANSIDVWSFLWDQDQNSYYSTLVPNFS